jgi:hypothetical protein
MAANIRMAGRVTFQASPGHGTTCIVEPMGRISEKALSPAVLDRDTLFRCQPSATSEKLAAAEVARLQVVGAVV